ncbi:MAG: MFS transporter [Phycisphaerae bacterium]
MTETPPETSIEKKHDPYEAWRYAPFRKFAAASAMVQIGAGAQMTAIGYEVYDRTGSSLSVGWTAAMLALPMLFLTIPAGVLADKLDRKNLIFLSMVGTTVTSFALAVTSYLHGPVWAMYLLLLVDATSLTLGRPARTAFQTQLVPRKTFENAMKWRSSLFQISAVAGPAAGGLIFAIWRPAAYLFAASTSISFMIALTIIHARPYTASSQRPSLSSALEGAKFVFHHKMLLAALSLDMFAVLLGGAVYLMPIFAKDILYVGEIGHGILRAAPAVGALCMGIFLAYRPPMKHSGRNMLVAVAGFGVATIVFGLSRNVYLSWAMLFATGALDNISVVVRHTLVQMITPDHMRGRVSAANTIFIGSSNELGGVESSVVARLFNPTISVVSGGIGTILVVSVTALASKSLRRVGVLSETAEQALGTTLDEADEAAEAAQTEAAK